MTASIDITESLMLTGIRSWLRATLPPAVEVVRGQVNYVPEPGSSDHAVMTPMLKRRLATNISAYQDIPGSELKLICDPTECRIQVDTFGPNSSDFVQMIYGLWRDESACEFFSNLTISKLIAAGGALLTTEGDLNIQVDVSMNAAPLDASEPRQLTFINGADVYERRWSTDLLIQINPVMTITQQYAGSIALGFFEVDATFPPN